MGVARAQRGGPRGLWSAVPLLCMAVGACQQDESTTPTPPSIDGGTIVADAGEDDGVTPLPPPVPFTITPHADPGCVATTSAVAKELATPPGLRLTDLETAGARRVARDLAGRGFILVDADGSAPSSAPIPVGTETRAAATETGVVAAGLGASSNVLVQRFDLAGAALGASQDLGSAKLGRPVGVGRAGDKSLVVWATPDDSLRARVLGPSGALATEISLESGAPFGDLSIAIAPSRANDGSHFLVVWALYRVALGAHRVYAALVNEQGVVGLPRVVFGSDVAVRLVGAVSSADGTMLLTNLDGEPMVVPLDALGRLAGAAHLLAGARDVTVGGGHGLARNGAEIAVVADHASGASAFRRLDPLGQPKEGWICLDVPRPAEFQLGGITSDGSGYAVVIAVPGGKTSLLRVDSTGRGPLP